MEIKASCRLDRKSVTALNRLMMFKKKDPAKRMRFRTVLYAVLAAVLLAEFLLLDASAVFLWPVLLFLLLICFWEVYLYFLLPRITFKRMAKMKNTENEYLFREEEVKISSTNPGYDGGATVRYDLFFKAYETSAYFFLLQTKNQAFPVDKSTLSPSDAAQIRAKLIERLGKKYIMCDY